VKYCCPFRSTTGEIHEIVVTLSEAETRDVLAHRREGRAAGAPNGPLPYSYAWRRASRNVPAEFEPLYAETRLVQ
jgi:hypothetical protein